MNGYRPLLLLLICAATVGCHYRDPSIDLLESELRGREDQVYMLEEELYRRCAQLDQCRHGCTCDSTAPVVSTPQPTPATTTPRILSTTPKYEILPQQLMPAHPTLDTLTPSTGQPTIEMPTQEDPVPDRPLLEPQPMTDSFSDGDAEYQIVPPEVQLPETSPPGTDEGLSPIPAMPLEPQPRSTTPGARPVIEGTQPSPTDATGRPPFDFSFRDVSPDDDQSTSLTTGEQPAAGESTVDAHVTHIVAKAELSGGRGFDHEETEADVLVVVEPRNKSGQFVELAGPVSVVVLDGDKVGSAARIARWDYDAGSARRAIRRSSLGQGIHLELHWPDAEPETEDLHVFIRYTTIEERRLETDLRLTVDEERVVNGRWRVVDRSREWIEEAQTQSISWPTKKMTPTEPANSGFTLAPLEPQALPRAAEQPEPVASISSDGAADWSATQQVTEPEWSPHR